MCVCVCSVIIYIGGEGVISQYDDVTDRQSMELNQSEAVKMSVQRSRQGQLCGLVYFHLKMYKQVGIESMHNTVCV